LCVDKRQSYRFWSFGSSLGIERKWARSRIFSAQAVNFFVNCVSWPLNILSRSTPATKKLSSPHNASHREQWGACRQACRWPYNQTPSTATSMGRIKAAIHDGGRGRWRVHARRWWVFDWRRWIYDWASRGTRIFSFPSSSTLCRFIPGPGERLVLILQLRWLWSICSCFA